MVGFRKESFYINKFGDELGKQKYREVVDKRIVRETRRTIELTDSELVKCEECNKIFKRITRTHLKSHDMSTREYIEKYPNSPIISNALKKLYSNTEESIKEKYGDKMGSTKWKNYQEIQAETNTFEYKATKYNMSREEFNSYNKERSCTLENFIERHGEESGIDKWNEYRERQRYTTTIDYFIEKYGQEDGEIKWEKFYRSRIESKTDRTSLQEIEVYNELIQNKIHLIQQFKIRKGRTFIYDFANEEKKFLIEYNGNIWHMNPTIYSGNDIQPRTGISAREVWDRDERKRKIAEDAGYILYTIWEHDWKRDKIRIIKEIQDLYEK